MSRFIDVQGEDIDSLSPDECARLFDQLLYCDAWRMGEPISEIQTTEQAVPDGGVDARAGRISSSGHVLHGNHWYQIKAGRSFSPWRESDIKKELKTRDGSALKPEILRCFQENGTYVLVCMKTDITVQKNKIAKDIIKRVLKSCGIKDPKVEVWGQGVITNTASQFPSVCMRFRNYGNLLTHAQWSKEPDMRNPLIDDKRQAEAIDKIRQGLHSRVRHIDICGEIGAGKTAMALEATRSPDLSSLVVYNPSPEDLQHARCLDEKRPCILVVDDCGQDGAWKIASRLESAETAQLITISTKCQRIEIDSLQVEAPALDAETLRQIIREDAADNITAGRLSHQCEGSPMMARMFSWALASGLDLLDGPQAKYRVFDKYIGQGGLDPTHLDHRRRILFTISLFKKFGNGSNFKEESDCVCKLVRRIDPNITCAIFQEHVSELRDLGILRGIDTVRVRFPPLHVWMWTQWWKRYANAWGVEMLADMPQSMQDGFIGMFVYASSSEDAVRVLADLFEGPLLEPRHLATGPGSALFVHWAAADPKAALRHLERVLRSDEGLSEAAHRQLFDPEDPGWGQPRPYRSVDGIARGLERIAFNKDLFARAAKMLMRLAEAGESQNEAANSLVSLFVPGIGRISKTEAPPHTRLPLLKEMLRSEKPTLQNLGFKACAAALSVPHSVWVYPGNDFVPDTPGWVPKTWGEWEDAYRMVIDIMLENMDGFSSAGRNECASIMAQHATDITGRVPGISGYVAESLSRIKDIIGKEGMVQLVTNVIAMRGSRMSGEDRRRFERLLSDLIGTSYAERLDTFACTDVLMGGTADQKNARMRELEALAAETDAERLEPELPWLVTKRAKCGVRFGVALAERDEGFALLQRILEAQRAAGPSGDSSFLCGYMSVVCEKDRALWRQTVNLASKDEKTAHVTGHLYWRSGCLDDDGGRHLLELARSGKIGADSLALFACGSAHKRLSDKVVMRWIEHMSGTENPHAVSGALHLFCSRFAQGRAKLAHPEMAVNLLLHDAFLDEQSSALCDPLLGTCWADVATKLKDDAEYSIVFASSILGRMDEWMAKCHPYVVPALDAIGAARPDDLWDVVAKHIAVPLDNKSQAIFAWMRAVDSSGDFLDGVDFAKVCKMIDGNPAELAPLVARWVRPAMSRNSIARNILYRYGSDQKVKDALFGNFFTGSFSGPESRHLEARKKELEDCKGPDDNENVTGWLDGMIDVIDERIARAKTAEERGPHG